MNRTPYNVTEQDIQILGSNIKQYPVKLEILNNQLQILCEIEGDCTSLSYDIDSTADIRRTCSLKMIVKDSTYVLNENSRVWINKFLNIKVGLQVNGSSNIAYYPIGLYTFIEDSYTYNSSDNSLEIKCADLMWFLSQTKLGGANTTKVPAGSIIRDVLISYITQIGNVSKYNIQDVHNTEDITSNTVPYDISMDAGSSLVEFIKKFIDLYVGYEYYFDLDTFVVRQIPTMIEDPIVLDYQTIVDKQLVLSEKVDIKFDSIYNVTEVFGKQLDVDYYSETITLNGNEFDATVDGCTELDDGVQIALKLPSYNPANATIKINSLTTIYPIYDTSGVILPANSINGYSVFRLHNSVWEYLGAYAIHSVCILKSTQPSDTEKTNDITTYNTNSIVYRIIPESQFSIEKIGVRKDVKSGSDYENIYSVDLCEQRARYENWKSTRFGETLELETQNILFADVNQKFTYKLKSTGEIKTWITNKISCNNVVGGTMTISANEFYSTFPNGNSY